MTGLFVSSFGALAGLVAAGLGALVAFLFALQSFRRGRVDFRALVAFLACLAAGAVLAVARDRAAGVEACGEELVRLGSAVALYQDNKGGELPESLEDLVPVYFTTLPTCPAARSVGADGSYVGGYERATAGFTVSCQGHRHDGLGGAPEGYPRFTSTEGLRLQP